MKLTPEQLAEKREELRKAMAELDTLEAEDALSKSREEGIDAELDALIKSAEQEFTLNDDLGDDLGHDGRRLTKSADDDNQALVDASEAFESLTKSVNDGIGGVHAEIAGIAKALAADLNLNVRTARAVADIQKSIAALGRMPVGTSETRLGTGSAVKTEMETGDMKKSSGEITDALLKAVDAGEVAAKWLSVYGSHKNVEMLPADVRTAIGL